LPTAEGELLPGPALSTPTTALEVCVPDSQDLQHAAEALRDLLGQRPFLTLRRSEVSDVVRQVSGDERTRLKARMSAELETKLLHVGVRCFPPLEETGEQTIRFFPTGSLVAALVDTVIDPAGNDHVLHELIEALPSE
jgi:hypothetical protein